MSAFLASLELQRKGGVLAGFNPAPRVFTFFGARRAVYQSSGQRGQRPDNAQGEFVKNSWERGRLARTFELLSMCGTDGGLSWFGPSGLRNVETPRGQQEEANRVRLAGARSGRQVRLKALPDHLFAHFAEGVAQGAHPAVVLTAINAGMVVTGALERAHSGG